MSPGVEATTESAAVTFEEPGLMNSAAGLADELHLVIAPFFVGDSGAPRFVGTGDFPHHPGNRMTLEEVRPIGDVILARYLLTHS